MDGLYSIQRQLQRATQKESESTRRVASFLAGTTPPAASADAADDPASPALLSELHRLAALTYNPRENAAAFARLGDALSRPAEHAPRHVERALVLCRHLMLYGCEQSVDHAWEYGRPCEALSGYSTALGRGIAHRIQGGGVDRGARIRELAGGLVKLLKDPDEIRRLRRECADPNSLVPVLEVSRAPAPSAQQQGPALSFGGGYGADGSQKGVVVGAAHSLEEMMATAARAPATRFYDDRAREEEELRRRGQPTGQCTDSAYTRQALAPDLLDLGFAGGGTTGHGLPEGVEDLAARRREEDLRKQVEELQARLGAGGTGMQQMPYAGASAFGTPPPAFGTPPPVGVTMGGGSGRADAISAMDGLAGLGPMAGGPPSVLPPMPAGPTPTQAFDAAGMQGRVQGNAQGQIQGGGMSHQQMMQQQLFMQQQQQQGMIGRQQMGGGGPAVGAMAQQGGHGMMMQGGNGGMAAQQGGGSMMQMGNMGMMGPQKGPNMMMSGGMMGQQGGGGMMMPGGHAGMLPQQGGGGMMMPGDSIGMMAPPAGGGMMQGGSGGMMTPQEGMRMPGGTSGMMAQHGGTGMMMAQNGGGGMMMTGGASASQQKKGQGMNYPQNMGGGGGSNIGWG